MNMALRKTLLVIALLVFCDTSFQFIQAEGIQPKENEKQSSAKDIKERIASVLRDVKDDDIWLLRYARTGVLADELGQSAIPEFFQAFRSEDEKVIAAAGFALARLFTRYPVPKEIQGEIMNMTKSQAAKRRRWSLCCLEFFDHPKRVEILTDRIENDPDPDVRECALETLKSFWGDKNIVPICIKALSDDYWKVASTARCALLNLTCLHFGFRASNDANANREAIAKWWDWWTKNKDKSVEEWRYQALANPDYSVRAWGVINVGDLADERRDYESNEIMIAITQNTSKFPPEIPPFQPPPGWPGHLDEKASVALRKTLKDKHVEVRRLAAKALAIRRNTRVIPIPTLKELLKCSDRNYGARHCAAYLLSAYYGDKSGIDVLIRDLDNTTHLLPDREESLFLMSFLWIRHDALEILRKLLGQNFGYVEPTPIVFDEEGEKQNEKKRKEALKQWKEWWKDNREKLVCDKEKKAFSLGQQ